MRQLRSFHLEFHWVGPSERAQAESCEFDRLLIKAITTAERDRENGVSVKGVHAVAIVRHPTREPPVSGSP